MKKYIKPSIMKIEVATTQIMAASPSISLTSDFVDESNLATRRHNDIIDFDDEEEDW